MPKDPKWLVEAPDGKVIQFPDNFTDADVTREMTKLYPSGSAASSAPKSSYQPQSTDQSMSAYDPGIMERMRNALPILDRLQTGFSRLTTPSSNQAVLQKPLPGMSDQRAVAPEQYMTQMEQGQNPISTGIGEFAGGMTTPENLMLQAGMAGPAPALISRAASGAFAANMLHGAAQEWPEFQAAVSRARQTGDYTDAKRIGTHLILGAGFAMSSGKQALTGRPGIQNYEQMTADGRELSKIESQQKSLGGIQSSGLGLYNNIANTLNTHIESLKGDALKNMEPVRAADRLKGGTPIDTAGIKARIDSTKAANGYHPSPAENALLDKIGGQQVNPVVDQTAKQYYGKSYNQLPPDQQQGLQRLLPPDLVPKQGQSMTIDDLLNLRTDIGNAASRNKDSTGKATMWAAYNEVGNAIKDATYNISGSTTPFEKYNNRFQMAFDLRDKGLTSDMLDNVHKPFTVKADPQVINRLKNFVESPGDLSEVKQQMEDMGNKVGSKKIDQHVKDAASIVAASGAVEGRWLKSISRQFQQSPKDAWPGVALALGTRGMLPFPFSFLMPAMVSSHMLTEAAKTKAGQLGLRLRAELPAEYFQGRPSLMQGEPAGVGGLNVNPSSPMPTPAAPMAPPAQSGPTPASRAASDAAFMRNNPPEAFQGGLSPMEKDLWQQSAFGQTPQGDIGAKVRAANPEPTRAEVKAGEVTRAKNEKSQ